MTDFLAFVSKPAADPAAASDIAEAFACLDRFTAHFNARHAPGMDAELQFPHLLLSGAACITWQTPGQHPADFFQTLEKTGWNRTVYEAKEPVLVQPDKIHVVVTYSRRDREDVILSMHQNLWILTKTQGRWGIVLRSY